MFRRPDPQSYTKFVVSAGVFLVVAAFVGPAFALRDTGVLRISTRELSGLTPIGREELIHRQRIEREIGRFALIVGAALFVSGAGLIGWGLPRLRKQETMEDARSAAELRKIQKELLPLSDEERKAKLQDEVIEQEEARSPTSAPSAGGASPRPTVDPVRLAATERVAKMKSASEVEKNVLARLVEAAPPGYEVRTQVRLANASLQLDAVLLSEIDQLDDVVVEIKYSQGSLRQLVGNRLAQTASTLMRYQSLTGRRSVAWLILVVEEPVEGSDFLRTLERVRKEYGGQLRVSVVKVDEIAALQVPDMT